MVDGDIDIGYGIMNLFKGKVRGSVDRTFMEQTLCEQSERVWMYKNTLIRFTSPGRFEHHHQADG
jgi:hypothetical protein